MRAPVTCGRAAGEDGLFGILDAAFGIDSLVFLFPVDSDEQVAINAVELVSKVAFLERVAKRLSLGAEIPIFDDLLELLVDSNEPWAPAEARWLASRRRGFLNFVARALTRGQAARATAPFLDRVTRNLTRLAAFAELAQRLHENGETVLVSVSHSIVAADGRFPGVASREWAAAASSSLSNAARRPRR